MSNMNKKILLIFRNQLSRIALKQLLEIATKYYKKTGFRVAIGDFKDDCRKVCRFFVWVRLFR